MPSAGRRDDAAPRSAHDRHEHAHHRHAHTSATHDHHHGHSHHGHGSTRQLAIALGLTLAFFVVELSAGIWTQSLALLSDAGHMLTDSGALTVALLAQRIARRPRTRVHTFGFRRAEILAASANGALLIATALTVTFEALSRLEDPPAVAAKPMLVVACAGLAVNMVAALVLGHGARESVNVRAALAHVLSDALGSAASIAAAIGILWFDFALADPLASLAIAILIGVAAVRLLKQTSTVLMETAPLGIDLELLERVILETPGVRELHDLHAWSISDGFAAVSVHVVLDGVGHGTDVARAVGERVRERFGINHVTVQPEAPPPSAQIVPVERLRRELKR